MASKFLDGEKSIAAPVVKRATMPEFADVLINEMVHITYIVESFRRELKQ